MTTFDDANTITQRILARVTTNYTYDNINQDFASTRFVWRLPIGIFKERRLGTMYAIS